MDLSDLLFEGKNDEMMIEMHQRLLDLGYNELEISRMNAKQAREIITNKEKSKKHAPVDPAKELESGETAPPYSIRKDKKEPDQGLSKSEKRKKRQQERVGIFEPFLKEKPSSEHTLADEEKPEESAEEIIDMEEYETGDPIGRDSWIPKEPRAKSKYEGLEKGSWQYTLEDKLSEADTLEDYLSILDETHHYHLELYKERNDDVSNKARKIQRIQSKAEEDIKELLSGLEVPRETKDKIVSRVLLAPDIDRSRGESEAEEQRGRDRDREYGREPEGISSYEQGVLDRLENEIYPEIKKIKSKIAKILRNYPRDTFSISTKAKSLSKFGGKGSDPAKHEKVKGLAKIKKEAQEAAPSMFVDDPEGLTKYEVDLDLDYLEYEEKIIKLAGEIIQLEQKRKAGKAEDDMKNLSMQRVLGKEANGLLADFREKYMPEEEESTKDSEFWDQNRYSKKFKEYMDAAASLPGSPPSIGESLSNLTKRDKFTSSAAKYPNINQVIDDKSLIDQVIRGVKPLAHVKTFRRQIKLTKEESQRVAYVLAPEQMGGGVIWYRPAQTAGERPYNKNILGYDPEDNKETTTKPYNPLKNDANLNIVELYIWNNIANRRDSRLYNFINGLCLGYPRDYVIWFCESKNGETDHRQPERSFWGRMLDRFRYCVNAGVNGYGRPGNIEPDGMFSKIFKSLTPNFINGWINKILGTSDELDSHKTFASAVDEFEPVRTPEKTKFDGDDDEEQLMAADINRLDDPIIESLFNKLDNL